MIDTRLTIVPVSERIIDAEKVLRLALDCLRLLRALGRERRGVRRTQKLPLCVEIDYSGGRPVIRLGTPGQPDGLEC